MAMMVQGFSARLFLPSEHRLPINKNHSEMVKFDSKVETIYQSVVYHMKACIGEPGLTVVSDGRMIRTAQ